MSPNETIEFLQVIIYALTAALTSVCLFFVAWVRTLYDKRETQISAELKQRDQLLERVLVAVSTLAKVVEAVKGREERR